MPALERYLLETNQQLPHPHPLNTDDVTVDVHSSDEDDGDDVEDIGGYCCADIDRRDSDGLNTFRCVLPHSVSRNRH